MALAVLAEHVQGLGEGGEGGSGGWLREGVDDKHTCPQEETVGASKRRRRGTKSRRKARQGWREGGREGGRGREGMANLLVVDVVVDVAEVPDGDVGGQLGVLGPELKGKREREERKGREKGREEREERKGGREGEIEWKSFQNWGRKGRERRREREGEIE